MLLFPNIPFSWGFSSSPYLNFHVLKYNWKWNESIMEMKKEFGSLEAGNDFFIQWEKNSHLSLKYTNPDYWT